MAKQDLLERRAAGALTMQPARIYSLDADGIMAALYRPCEDAYPGKALIVIGGGDGVYGATKLVAERFCAAGMTALALAYWTQPGLPQNLARVPLEFVERAAEALRAEGASQVGVWGISKGAELALCAASSFPEDIGCVVAASPFDAVCQGILPSFKGLAEGSSWTLGGSDVPFVRTRFSKPRIIADSIRARGLCIRSCYEAFEGGVPEDARIKVERIAGPILLLSTSQDGMWPAKEACERIEAKLDEVGFAYEHTHLSYDTVSHFIMPADLRSARIYAIERKEPAACSAARADSTEKTLAFLSRW